MLQAHKVQRAGINPAVCARRYALLRGGSYRGGVRYPAGTSLCLLRYRHMEQVLPAGGRCRNNKWNNTSV